MKYTDEMKQFVFDNYIGKSTSKLVDEFNEKFCTDISRSQMKAFKGNHHLNSGLTGKFEKGQAPHNKGKKMPVYVYEKCKETMFKKGNVPLNHRPVGSERVNVYGYIEIKVEEPNRWRQKHQVVYEKEYGSIADGNIVVFKDGNKLNCDVKNLALVSRAELLYMNRSGLFKDNPELTETGVLIAKLETIKNKKRRKL